MGVACCANDPASQSILPNSQTVTMLLCREQLYLAPNRPIARPSKTQGRATQAIQSSMHPGRANPPRSRTPKNRCSAFFRGFCGHQMKPQKTQKSLIDWQVTILRSIKGGRPFDEGWNESRVGPGGPTHVLRGRPLGSQFVIPIPENHATGSLSTLNSFTKASFGRCAPFEPFPPKPIMHPLEGPC